MSMVWQRGNVHNKAQNSNPVISVKKMEFKDFFPRLVISSKIRGTDNSDKYYTCTDLSHIFSIDKKHPNFFERCNFIVNNAVLF